MPEQKTPDGEVGSAGLASESLTRRERDVLALLAQGYSGPEIADKLTLATSSVKSHIQHLYGKLGVNNKRQAVARAREIGLLERGQPVLMTAAPRHSPTLPKQALPIQVTRFFGREEDIAHVRERLAEWRLVTLTGAGGVGKTRLSLRVAEEALDDFPDGVCFVALAPLSDPAHVEPSLAASLRVTISATKSILEQVTVFLGDQQLLMVLDNCEHLLSACAPMVDGLLRGCPRLRVLATSREPLGVAGEAVFVVPSLPFPDAQRLPALERLDQYTALSLFLDRTRAVVPDYAITTQNAYALARICQRLDGIPFALELAAARMNTLTAEQIAGRLDDALAVLSSGLRTALPRHQTLRATIDWSYQLLAKQERLLLRRLAVFKGGCTLEAAEAVCSGHGLGSGAVLGLLGSLVSKSMVVADRRPSEEIRYRLLEMVHQYATQMLDEAGERDDLSRRLFDHFLLFAERNCRRLVSKERPVWLQRLEDDIENLRAALAWSFADASRFASGVTLLLSLKQAWFIWDRYYMGEWVDKAIELWQGGAGMPAALEARFLAWASTCYPGTDLARPLAQKSLAISRGLGPEHRETLCWSLWVMAVGGCYLEILPEHWDESEALLDEQDRVIPDLGPDSNFEPPIYKGYNLWLRAVLANYRGRHAQAREYALESIRLFEAGYHGLHVVGPYVVLGDTALRTGDYAQAHAHFANALRLMVRTDVRFGDIQVLLCETEMRRGNLRQAFEYCKDEIRRTAGRYTMERIEMAARIFAKLGRYQEAARLSAATAALSEKIDWCRRAVSPNLRPSYWGDWRTRFADVSLDVLVPDLSTRIDREAILESWNAGRAMTYDETIVYVLNGLAI